jgi:predicted nucleotidyltransferase
MAPMSFDGGGTGRLYVAVDGETIWRSFDPKRQCPPGRHIVRVEIAAGVVVNALPFGGVQFLAPAETCAADLVHGLEIEGVADGEYRAEVVVEAVGSK